VVQRTEQEDGVPRSVVEAVEPAGVADACVEDSGRRCLLDVERHRIDERDVVALRLEPEGMDTGASADVEDGRRGRRQPPAQQLPRAQPLDPIVVEARRLPSLVVVGADVAVHVRDGTGSDGPGRPRPGG
jgi:hypothetical protein